MAAKADQILLKIKQKKARKSFFIPPNKEDGEKKWIGKNEIMDFTLWAKKTTKQSKEIIIIKKCWGNSINGL